MTNEQRTPRPGPELDTGEARQGTTPRVARYALIGGLILVVIAFIAAWVAVRG